MQRLLITTTFRKANINDPSGYLYVFDLDKWKIIQRSSIIEPPYRAVDPNPRGGLRGGKGIAIYRDQILLANSVAVFRFNQDWDLLNVVSHASCSGIHDILIDNENNLWITSARNDLLFQFDVDGNLIGYFYFRRNQFFRNFLQWARPEILTKEDILNGRIDFRDPRTHELTSHDSTHINSVCQHPDGSLLISLGLVVGRKFSTLMRIKDLLSQLGLWAWIIRINQYLRSLFSLEKNKHSDLVILPAKGKSIIVRLWPGGDLTPSLMLHNTIVPSHSVISRSDGTAIYLNTTTGEVEHFNPDNGQILSSTKVSSKFLRGIVKLSDDRFAIGSQNCLLSFDLSAQEIKKEVALSKDPNEAVFAIHEFPEKFPLPPTSFEEHLGKLVGVSGRQVVFE